MPNRFGIISVAGPRAQNIMRPMVDYHSLNVTGLRFGCRCIAIGLQCSTAEVLAALLFVLIAAICISRYHYCLRGVAVSI